jgi:hypothetical protein
MKNTKLRKATQKVFDLDAELSQAVQKVEQLLIYKDFEEWDEPQASLCHGGEFILEYKGSEIFIEQAIKLMETRGYIVPGDF